MTEDSDAYKIEGFKWTKETTLLLVSLIKEHFNQLQTGRKKVAYQKIAKQINAEAGTSLNYEQVDSKWKGMKRTFIKLQNSNANPRQARKCWEFYELVDEILTDTPEIKPQFAMSTEDIIAVDCGNEFNHVDFNEISISSPTHDKSRKRLRCYSEAIEEAKERRHQEKMIVANRFLNIFQQMVDKM